MASVAAVRANPMGALPTAHGVCLARYARIDVNQVARTSDEMAGIGKPGVTPTVATELTPRSS